MINKYPIIYNFTAIGGLTFTDNMVDSLKKRLHEIIADKIKINDKKRFQIKTINDFLKVKDIEKLYDFILLKNRKNILWTYSDYKIGKMNSYLIIKTIEFGSLQSPPIYFFRKIHNQLISEYNNSLFLG